MYDAQRHSSGYLCSALLISNKACLALATIPTSDTISIHHYTGNNIFFIDLQLFIYYRVLDVVSMGLKDLTQDWKHFRQNRNKIVPYSDDQDMVKELNNEPTHFFPWTFWRIPFIFGIGFGTSIALLGLTPESDPWFWTLLFITYGISISLTTILTTRILLRVTNLLKQDEIQNEADRRFLTTLVYAAIMLFGGAIGDIIIFTVLTFSGLEYWQDVISLGGVITIPILLFAFWVVRRFFRNLERANVLHVMNLLSLICC